MSLWTLAGLWLMILSNGKANKMTEKIIISKELNEWLLLNRDKWEVEE